LDVAGTALKSVMSRIFQVGQEGVDDAGKSEKLLNQLGITTRKSATEFKTFDDILKSVHDKFPSLTSVQQQNLLQQLAGIQHVGKLTSLMNNWDIATQATTKALNSQGSEINENEKYLNSIQGKYQTLKTTVDGLYDKLISSDALKSTVTGMTDVLNVADRVTTVLGGLNTIILTVVSSLGILKAQGIINFFTSLVTSVAGATFSLAGLGTVLTAIISPVGLLITVLGLATAGTIAYVNSTQKIKEQAELATKSQDDFNKSIKEFTETLDPNKLNDASTALEKLKEATNYKEAIENVKGLEAEIKNLQEAQSKEIMPEDISSINEKIKEKTALLQEQKKIIDDVAGKEKDYAHQKEISTAIDYQSIQAKAKTVALKVQETNENYNLVQSYKNVYDKLSANKELTEDEKALNEKLLQQYPEYRTALGDKAKALGVNYTALSENLDIQKKVALAEFNSAKVSAQQEVIKTNNLIDETKKRIEAIQSEIKAKSNLASAQDKLEDSLGKSFEMMQQKTLDWEKSLGIVSDKKIIDFTTPGRKNENEQLNQALADNQNLLDKLELSKSSNKILSEANIKDVLSISADSKAKGYNTLEAEQTRKEQEKADKKAAQEAERERKKQEAEAEAYRKKAEQEKYNSERETALGTKVDLAREAGYDKLTQAVKSYDVALSENQANQEKDNLSLQDKLSLMEEEKDLLKSKWKAYNDLIWQKRQEREETAKSLAQFGVGVGGKGESSYLTNVDESAKAQQEKIRKSAEDIHDEASLRAYKTEVARGEVLKSLVKTFGDLNPEISGYSINLNKITGTINKLNPEVEVANQEFKDFDKTIKSNNENMATLKDNYDSISDTDFDTKIKAGNDLLDAQTSSLDVVNKKLSEYDAKIKSAMTTEAKELYQAEKDKYTSTGAGISKDIVSTKKNISQLTFEKGEAPFKESEKAYEKASQDLEYKYEMIDEKNYKSRARNLNVQASVLKGETKSISSEIKRLKDDLAKTEDKDEQARINTSIANNEKLLQEKNVKIKDLTKSALGETISGSFKKSDDEAKKFDKTISGLDNSFQLLSDNDFVGKGNILSEKINKTNTEISKQQKELTDLNSITDKSVLNSQEYKDKLENLKSSLEANKISVKGYNDELKSLNKTQEDNIQNLIRTGIEAQKNIEESPIKSKEEELATQTRVMEREFHKEEVKLKQDLLNLEKKIYGTTKANYEDNIKNITTDLQNQIDAMQTQADLQKQQEERSAKILEIEKEKLNLSNLQAEKDVRIFQDGKWQWVADPKKVTEQKDKITKLTDDFNKSEADNTLKSQEDALKSKIDNYNKELEIKNKNYDDQSKALEDLLQKYKDRWETEKYDRTIAIEDERIAFENRYKNLDVMVANSLDQLKKTYGTKWNEILTVVTDKTSKIQIQYNTLQGYSNVLTGVDVSTVATKSGNTGVSQAEFNAQQEKNKEAQSGKHGVRYNVDGTIQAYATGGLNETTGIHMLHGTKEKPELVLNSGDTQNMLEMLKVARQTNVSQSNIGLNSTSTTSTKVENYNINVGEVVTNDATAFIQNLRNLAIKK